MRLYTFPISHYAEKARWALDYKQLDYEEVPLLIGLHPFTIKRLAPDTKVPVLEDGDTVVQGSARIVDYLDEHYPDRALTPTDPDARARCAELERELDDDLGFKLRNVFYFHSLPDKEFTLKFFLHDGPSWGRLFYFFVYGLLRRGVARHFHLSPEQAAADTTDVLSGLERIEARTRETGFLVGGEFTRADLAMAALVGPVCRPSEHPFPWPEFDEYPPGLREAIERFERSPVLDLVREHYAEFRVPRSA